MYNQYLITGGTGFLGNTVIKQLLLKGANIKALVMPNDSLVSIIPEGVEICYGRVDDINSLENFFQNLMSDVCLIHSAGIISISSKRSELLKKVNVDGTKNVTDLCCKYRIKKMIYVSSVHAIAEKPKDQVITESSDFSADVVKGEYAKTKAEATAYVLAACKKGLDVSIVHPSGIIGPNDNVQGSITKMIISYCKGKLPVGVKGGYDFVDVRDVADGIIKCTERGRKGECYILSNCFLKVKELLQTLKIVTNGKRILMFIPLWVGKMVAPAYEKYCNRKKKPAYFTPYSMFTLGTNANFSHQKATEELGYKPRSMKETLIDTIGWLKSKKVIESN